MSARSVVLVVVQIVTAAALLLTGPIFPQPPEATALVIAGMALAVWGILTLRLRNLSVAPEVKRGGMLITSGPYRVVRHPMYSGLVLVTIVWVSCSFSWLRLGLGVTLVVNILFKLHYEERLLAREYRGYEEYRRRTKRLIPFVY